jgi:hypothetical protein
VHRHRVLLSAPLGLTPLPPFPPTTIPSLLVPERRGGGGFRRHGAAEPTPCLLRFPPPAKPPSPDRGCPAGGAVAPLRDTREGVRGRGQGTREHMQAPRRHIEEYPQTLRPYCVLPLTPDVKAKSRRIRGPVPGDKPPLPLVTSGTLGGPGGGLPSGRSPKAAARAARVVVGSSAVKAQP